MPKERIAKVPKINLANKIAKIALIVYDFDGVLTDNRVLVDENGCESVVVNRSDGLAISWLRQAGIKQVIITTETNKVVVARARKLRIPVIRGVDDKRLVLLAYSRKHKINLKETIYIGNDLNDGEAMKLVGYPVCPADAAGEIRAISCLQLKTSGGAGVVRDLFRYLMLSNKPF